MPLSMMGTGKRCRIKAVKGDDAVRHRLGALGFVEGMEVEVVAKVADKSSNAIQTLIKNQ